MYFDVRLFALTVGLRGRILLAALVGLAALPLNLARLALSGVVIAGVIRGQSVGEDLPLIGGLGLLIVARSLVALWKEEIANRTGGEMKIRLREKLYRH